MFISACVFYTADTCYKGDAVDGMFSNNIHPHMECGTAKTLMELFLYRIRHHHSVAGGWIRTLREGEADYGKYTSGSSGWRACAMDGRRRCVQVVARAWKLHYSWS